MQNEVLDGMFTFYDSTKATLNVYQVHFCTSAHLLTSSISGEHYLMSHSLHRDNGQHMYLAGC